uniref:WD repeat-containing protein 59 n=1 Tax=Cacopsylla melanoneura TaxID=428564 RepID=A0A8D8YFZ7_9HEMI
MVSVWSNELVLAEHRELQATAFAVDTSGKYVLLAGRRYFGVKNLDDPSAFLRKFPRHSKHDCKVAQWNPTSFKKEYCAVATSQRVEVLTWSNTGDLELASSLQYHSRIVNDISWHRFDPNLILSCSIDTFTHIWDIREPRKPTISFKSVLGAIFAQWNKVSGHLLATAHDGDVRLWDVRNGTAPVEYISAHLANITSLDWSPLDGNMLSTASQDCTVKFWNVQNPHRPDTTITATCPVWRARYAPFGSGLLMIIIPPMRRGENSLVLWNVEPAAPSPVHTFVGHTDVVLEFEWRKPFKGDMAKEYQLVTWSRDQTLRMWRIDPALQKLCGYEASPNSTVDDASSDMLPTDRSIIVVEPGEVTISRSELSLANGNSGIESLDVVNEDQKSSKTQAKNLAQELNLFTSTNFNNVKIIDKDVQKRFCLIAVSCFKNSHVLNLKMTFPKAYPFNVVPGFQFEPGTTIEETLQVKLLKLLKQTSLSRVRKGRPCVEFCVRTLVTSLDIESPVSRMFSSYQDEFIPFPRTSGAKFSAVGILVCFNHPSWLRPVSKSDMSTPRALSALSGTVNLLKKRAAHSIAGEGGNEKPYIVIYDVSCLFHAHQDLALRYVLSSDPAHMCRRNAEVALSIGRHDLHLSWTLVALAVSTPPPDSDEDMVWSQHPCVKPLIHSLILHYGRNFDHQTAAMLSCVFSTRVGAPDLELTKQVISKSASGSPGGSPYHTIHQVDLSSWSFSKRKQHRSNSWSDSLDDLRAYPNTLVEHCNEAMQVSDVEQRLRVTDEVTAHLYEQYKLMYADMLHRWHLLNERTALWKHIVSNGPEVVQRGVEVLTECIMCKEPSRDPRCPKCKALTVQCVICHLSVRGVTNFCLVCGHGGHTNHMAMWFASETVCASGCGCSCLEECASVLGVEEPNEESHSPS